MDTDTAVLVTDTIVMKRTMGIKEEDLMVAVVIVLRYF